MTGAQIAGRRVLTNQELNHQIPDHTYMLCPYCKHEEWVSPEDPDTSQNEFVHHLAWAHHCHLNGPDGWEEVLRRVLVVTES